MNKTANSSGSSKIDADKALSFLVEGNKRFTSGKMLHPRQDRDRRELTSSRKQEPIAVILACSDSRAPLEVIFDQGIGDLFEVRVAGNVVENDELASIEYAVEHLGVTLVVVLGHTSCGVIEAILKNYDFAGSLPELFASIQHSILKVKQRLKHTSKKEVLYEAIKSNVLNQMKRICLRSPGVKSKVLAGNVKIVGGVYDLNSGEIHWLGEHKLKKPLDATDRTFFKQSSD